MWTKSTFTIDYTYSSAAASAVLRLTVEWEHNGECLIKSRRAIPAVVNKAFLEVEQVTIDYDDTYDDKPGCEDSSKRQDAWDVRSATATFLVKSSVPIPIYFPGPGFFTVPNPFATASVIQLQMTVFPDGSHRRDDVFVDGVKQP
ncbi:MAG TPA: hypothetical protein VER58_06675 [Thermoanaerobaculia bacterium]|nr:hypothetical protein [Thermoanaerobaculia bacterium]